MRTKRELKTVNEDKQLEIDELRLAEEKYRFLFNSVPVGIGIADLEGNVLDANLSIQEMLGYTLEELKSIGVGALYAFPEERRLLIKTLQETGRFHDLEVRLKRKDGTIYYALLNVDLLELDGSKVLLTTARDITERKRMEERLREGERFLFSIFESIQDGIGILDKDMNIIRVNPTAQRWYPHISSFIGRKCYEAYHGRSERCEVCPAWRTLRTGESAYDVVSKHGAGGKQVGWLEIYSFPLIDTMTGQMRGVIEYVRDITERKKTEEAIEKYARELEESNRMKELFTDIMHHDLLNPLNNANGFIELLKEDETDPKKIAYLDRIERNLVRGIDLIEHATMFSKLESLESIDFETLDLSEVIARVIENLAPLAARAGMRIESNINISMVVRGNNIIEEVLSNLITNSIKYAHQGNRIIVEGEGIGDFWRVKVIDFGEGINDSDKTRIFERFRRVEKKGVKGSGLGLAIAGKIVELHRGRIWVENNPEGGAVFVVEIPRNLK